MYNASGVRTKKTVGSEVSEYYYSEGQLAYEKRGNKELYYSYDQDGTIAAICYVKEDGTTATYYPAVNSRGDVEALYNYKGELVAEYCYDSWGKVISIKNASGNEITTGTHIGLVNPIRYRGYYYDAEAGFYYLNSRYYDPEVGRFLNADVQISGVGGNIGGYNLYSYCMNNPVNMSDSDGDWPSWMKKVAKAAVVAAVVTLAVTITAGAAAVALGASLTVTSSVMAGAAIGGVVAGTANIVTQSVTKGVKNINIREVARSTAIGSASGSTSSGCASVVSAAKNSSTELLVQKGLQAGANMLISNTAYITECCISGQDMSLYGTTIANLSGFISGATFNASATNGVAISIGLETAANGEELITIFK